MMGNKNARIVCEFKCDCAPAEELTRMLFTEPEISMAVGKVPIRIESHTVSELEEDGVQVTRMVIHAHVGKEGA